MHSRKLVVSVLRGFSSLVSWLHPVIRFCEALGKVAILVGIISWCWEIPDRAEQRHNAAWALLNSAQGKPGNGGRTSALRTLSRDGISLSRIDLSEAYLQGIDLSYADLGGASFQRADLRTVNFGCSAIGRFYHGHCTYLGYTNFLDALLSEVDFRRSFIEKSQFGSQTAEKEYFDSDFSGAVITDTTFENIEFHDSDFSSSVIFRTRFDHVKFSYEPCCGGLFDKAEFHDVDLSHTTVDPRILTRAKLCHVKMPDGKFVDQNCS